MKPNNWVSSAQALELLAKQVVTWPLAARNFQALKAAQVRELDLDGRKIRVQFNPARIRSACAHTDVQAVRERPCFLCAEQLPVEQERLPFGSGYLILCNPYPIFPHHFTIPSREHAEQCILPRLEDFLELCSRLRAFALFYNGPRCGASAPDHAHFQAVTKGCMPIDTELDMLLEKRGLLVREEKDGRLSAFTCYLRNGFVIDATSVGTTVSLFRRVYEALDTEPEEIEPRLNLFGYYSDRGWRLVVIPRRRHRPRQYDAPGTDRFLTSPGAADVGGFFIVSRTEDWEKVSPELLRDVYEQVCMPDAAIEELATRIREKG